MAGRHGGVRCHTAASLTGLVWWFPLKGRLGQKCDNHSVTVLTRSAKSDDALTAPRGRTDTLPLALLGVHHGSKDGRLHPKLRAAVTVTCRMPDGMVPLSVPFLSCSRPCDNARSALEVAAGRFPRCRRPPRPGNVQCPRACPTQASSAPSVPSDCDATTQSISARLGPSPGGCCRPPFTGW